MKERRKDGGIVKDFGFLVVLSLPHSIIHTYTQLLADLRQSEETNSEHGWPADREMDDGDAGAEVMGANDA